MSKALAVFYACTGCDTVLYFTPRGKKTAVTVWKSLPAVTDAFLQLATSLTSPIREARMEHLERYVILMYDTTIKKQLFAQKGRAYDAIDSTKKVGPFTAHKQGR